MRQVFAGLGIVLVLALSMGCGDDSSDQPEAVAEPETVTVEKTVPAEEPEPVAEPEPEPEPAEPVEESSGGITVPNVVGKDHQLAQDTMQAAGLYILEEKDCTGQDRFLLWDRNWVVVEQDPPPGSKVSGDTTITLCSKKDGE